MSAALWMIIYDLDPANADSYLQWFDEVHIPEKLARPGYTWAAHYQVIDHAIAAILLNKATGNQSTHRVSQHC